MTSQRLRPPPPPTTPTAPTTRRRRGRRGRGGRSAEDHELLGERGDAAAAPTTDAAPQPAASDGPAPATPRRTRGGPPPTDQPAPPITSPDEGGLPFATATVGQIYLDQGKLDQSEVIFTQVLARQPDDPRCKAGLREIERRRLADSSLVVDSVEVEVLPNGSELSCRWKVSAEGSRRARLVTSEDGKLVLRLVSFPAAPDAPPIDAPLEADSGSLLQIPPDGAMLAAAAVGLLTSTGQFVSIAHSKIVQLKQ